MKGGTDKSREGEKEGRKSGKIGHLGQCELRKLKGKEELTEGSEGRERMRRREGKSR